MQTYHYTFHKYNTQLLTTRFICHSIISLVTCWILQTTVFLPAPSTIAWFGHWGSSASTWELSLAVSTAVLCLSATLGHQLWRGFAAASCRTGGGILSSSVRAASSCRSSHGDSGTSCIVSAPTTTCLSGHLWHTILLLDSMNDSSWIQAATIICAYEGRWTHNAMATDNRQSLHSQHLILIQLSDLYY